MKLLRRIAIGFGMLAFALSCAAVMLIARPSFGWQALSVPTGSMRPVMSPGSVALVHRVPAATLKVGDIITYTNPATMKGTITHRIVRINNLNGFKTFVTKGDANKLADPLPAIAGLIQGKTVWHAPYLGAWLLWSKTWFGIALLVYLPATILIFGELRRLSGYWRLTMPKSYRLFAYRAKVRTQSLRPVRYVAAVLAILFVGANAIFALPVYALLQSNVVTLSPNTLTAIGSTTQPPPSNCTNNTNVNVNSTSNQSASSGSANNSGSTTGGNATSGNASNSNSTNVNVSVTNGC